MGKRSNNWSSEAFFNMIKIKGAHADLLICGERAAIYEVKWLLDILSKTYSRNTLMRDKGESYPKN